VSSRIKLVSGLILLVIILTIIANIIEYVYFTATCPPFVFAMVTVWAIALVLLLAGRTKWGLILGIVMSIVTIPIPFALTYLGIQSTIGAALGIPACPFAWASMLLSWVILYSSATQLRQT